MIVATACNLMVYIGCGVNMVVVGWSGSDQKALRWVVVAMLIISAIFLIMDLFVIGQHICHICKGMIIHE
jgi:hypothetical protein